MTWSNAVSAVTVKVPLRSVLASEREILSSLGNSTMRGSGLHHRIGSPALYQGKMPRR